MEGKERGSMAAILRGVLLCVTLTLPALAQSSAYEFRGDQIHVERSSQWRNWVYQNNLVRDLQILIDSTGLFDFSSAGIKPKYLPGTQNYVLDREQFEYLEQVVLAAGAMVRGTATARSNDVLARNVGDADASTFWEPAATDYSKDGMRNWQVEVNLGRCIWADSIVVLFPPLESGGEVPVPIIPAEVTSTSEMTIELQLAVDRFGRAVAMDSLVWAETVVDEETGDTLVVAGQVLIRAAQQLPRSLPTLKLLNRLGVTSVEVLGGEDPGDVPKLFVVEASMGRRAGDSSSKNYRFTIVGRGARLGAQRRYSFRLEPLDLFDWDGDGLPDMDGSFVHLVRLSVFESDLNQAEFLGEDEEGQAAYEALSVERRGLRAYFRRTEGNFLKQVDATVYDGLNAASRGPVRYYKRELPRVAEIQVWGAGPNVAYQPHRRAGAAFEDGRGTAAAPLAFDGVYLTRWISDPYFSGFSTNGGAIPGKDQIYGTVWVDLGASFWVNRMFTGSLTSHDTSTEGALWGFFIQGSDGTALQPLDVRIPDDFIQLEEGLAWETLVSDIHVDNWDYRTRLMGETFDLRKLRFLEFRHVDPRGIRAGQYGALGYINEMQLFGEGYPAETSFTSPAIVLEQGISSAEAGLAEERQILSQISWETEAVVHRVDPLTGQHLEEPEPLASHPELKVELQTRSSDTVDSLATYYEVTGLGTAAEKRTEVDADRYQEVKDLWDKFYIWDAMPDSRTVTLLPHRTNRDDDGDGRIDEDPMDLIDNDGDGMVDEDGLTGDTGGPNGRGTIVLNKHANKSDDDGDAQVDEDPIDGMDNDGDGLIDEDGRRVTAPRSLTQEIVSPFFAGWSAWSQPYAPIGGQNSAPITSPSPRKYLQMRVNIVSSDPDVTGRVKSLRIDLSPPISTDAAGELAVRRRQGLDRALTDPPAPEDYAAPDSVSPLRAQEYSYFIRAAGPDANVAEVAAGFDQVKLVTPFGATLTGVRLGHVELEEVPTPVGDALVKRAVRSTFTSFFVPSAPGVFRDAADGTEIRVTTGADSLLVDFPTSVNQGFSEMDNALVELQVESRTLRDGTQFLASVRGEGIAFYQRVEAEGRDVTELVYSQTSTPRLVQRGKLIEGVEVSEFVTPNNDRINDELTVEFSVVHVREDRPVEIALFDLAGRRVYGEVLSAQSGTVTFTWDGRDQGGNLVMPGIYLCQIELRSDDDDLRIVRLVNVAY